MSGEERRGEERRTAECDPIHVRLHCRLDLLLLALLQELDCALQTLALVAELAAEHRGRYEY